MTNLPRDRAPDLPRPVRQPSSTQGAITVYVYFKVAPDAPETKLLEQFEALTRALTKSWQLGGYGTAPPSHTLMQRVSSSGQEENTWMEVHSGLGQAALPYFLNSLSLEAARTGWAAWALAGRHLEIFSVRPAA